MAVAGALSVTHALSSKFNLMNSSTLFAWYVSSASFLHLSCSLVLSLLDQSVSCVSVHVSRWFLIGMTFDRNIWHDDPSWPPY